ncbi:MAG: hypothetical protein FGF51_04255 [Candidatus Brockarchaeota archaeon]|nr:hypothetical protein [Candidatus Brockarchaeota archaeon]
MRRKRMAEAYLKGETGIERVLQDVGKALGETGVENTLATWVGNLGLAIGSVIVSRRWSKFRLPDFKKHGLDMRRV